MAYFGEITDSSLLAPGVVMVQDRMCTAYKSSLEAHTQVCAGFARPFFTNDSFVESVGVQYT